MGILKTIISGEIASIKGPFEIEPSPTPKTKDVSQEPAPDFFLTSYSEECSKRIKNSPSLVFDLETTGLTMQSHPVRVGKSTKIGNLTYLQYKKDHPSCEVDTTLRIRVVSIQTGDGWKAAFDLDALSPEAQKQLLHDCVNGKILIGHNLGFDLSWCSQYVPEARPSRILDTMLITRIMKPELPLRIHRAAALEDQFALELAQKAKKLVGVSLEAVSAALDLPIPDKAYQKPENWTLSILSKEHFEYAIGDVNLPLLILNQLLETENSKSIEEYLVKLPSIYTDVYEKAIYTLVQCHRRGMPLHLPTVANLINEQTGMFDGLADEIISHFPEMTDERDSLVAVKASLPNKVKYLWAKYALRNGIELPVGKNGVPKISTASVKSVGLDTLPAWKSWEKLQGLKKQLSMLLEYQGISATTQESEFNRLRSLASISCVTGRTASSVPNIQNLPRDESFRSIIRAKPDYSILSADYAQIELRIASALAVRTMLKIGSGQYTQDWIEESLRLADSDKEIITPDTDPWSLDNEQDRIAAFKNKNRSELAAAYRGVLEFGTPLKMAFQEGLDPHLITAVSMAEKQNFLNLAGKSPLEFVRALNKEEQNKFKEKLKNQRQAGKAVAFGLLYGMSAGGLHIYGRNNYGLDWTEEEAEQARLNWFLLYPEIRLWQLWTKHTQKVKSLRKNYVFKDFNNKLEKAEADIWKVHTLSGRPLIATSIREALNYQDQGTGADMILSAASSLPEPASNYLINIIHDELLLEIPEGDLELVKEQVINTMKISADNFLSPYEIPAEVEANTDEVWRH